eukprot:CAMPEP_0116030962 /NCGR_PEP_ID=MMETSP0321-20121206/17194_1 /TAXON_ID=163516 /ORGANISM="Leptocylindrus danicus var. danicus, Strain B650" /LENGTH=563 /DNA_ID=CAMNT_0003505923 /DNA_START=84 /DNA_END=1775 /DNA_ORIENTATION=+
MKMSSPPTHTAIVISIALSTIITSLPLCESFTPTTTQQLLFKNPIFPTPQHYDTRTTKQTTCRKHNIHILVESSSSSLPIYRTSQQPQPLFATRFDNNNNANKDPYAILDIPFGTTDKKVIKRAYKRAAMKYHPDVNQEDPNAADKFIEICNAYELLTTGGGTKSAGSSSTASSAASSAGYEPPHRRSSSYSGGSSSSSSYSGSSGNTSTDWKDYIPYDADDEKYDAGGDSFGSIFSDLFTGVAAAAAGYKSGGNRGGSGGGILEDLVEFLEGTVDGFASEAGYDADPDLLDLLSRGSLEEVRVELEDAELLVKQLETKCDGIKRDIASVINDLELNVKNAGQQKSATQVLRLDEELNEQKVSLEAREKVVMGYLTKARKRLILLQDRVVELRSSSRGGRSTSNTANDTTTTAGSYNSGSYSNYSSTSNPYGGSTTTGANQGNASGATSNRESFGSSGRGRGRSRSRSRATTQPTPKSYSSQSTPPPPPPPPPPRRETTYANTSNNNASRSSNLSNVNNSGSSKEFVPPHRRKSSSSDYSDKKRLREFKVDEEFDKLKRDLGL